MNKNNPKSLYVHIPFCVKKCLFCSFAVSIGQTHRTDEYLDALEIESKTYEGTVLSTIYLGGGTPTFLSVGQLDRLVSILRRQFVISDDAEWTIEANPEGMDAPKAKALRELGFTRLSLGVQSFNDAYLKFLGRAHDRSTALRAFETARAAGFDNINVDLMYGFPKQERAELHADLDAVTALQSEHVSIYTLTIEPNSRFYAKQMKLDHDDKLADDYIFVAEQLERNGLKQYEISNFAKLGSESRHNRGYWTGIEYIGLGMGAHSFSGRERSWNTENLKEYLGNVKAKGHAKEDQEILSPRTQLLERLVLGLRMNQGVDLSIIEKELGGSYPKETLAIISDLIQTGFLTKDVNYLKTTSHGRLVLDQISTQLI